MKLIDTVKSFISRYAIKEVSTDIIEDIVNAILGDKVALKKLAIAFARMPFFVREQIFWAKIEAFINGAYQSEEDSAKLCAKLTENGDKLDNTIRLIESIDRAETQQKVRYLINATRCFLTDFIDRPTYFRICHAVTHTLEEDLIFLAKHINEEELEYSTYTQGLLTSGLMYQSVIDGNGNAKYSFTPIAEIVDQYAVSYEDVARYPNLAKLDNEYVAPQSKLPSIPKSGEI